MRGKSATAVLQRPCLNWALNSVAAPAPEPQPSPGEIVRLAMRVVGSSDTLNETQIL